MTKHEKILERVRAICLSFPETKETMTWGQPHFRVRDRIFAGCGLEKGRQTLGFKLERPHAEAILDDERFKRAPYVGHAGWISMDTAGIKDWREVRDLIAESYRLIAPKSCLVHAGLAPAKLKAPAKPKAGAKAKTGAKPKATRNSSRPSRARK